MSCHLLQISCNCLSRSTSCRSTRTHAIRLLSFPHAACLAQLLLACSAVLLLQGKWFISLDQQSIQIWGRNHLEPDRIEVHQKQTFPDNRAHFISAVTHAAPLGPATPIILAACLDHTLKVYSEKLRLRSSIKWDAGTFTMMVYNTKNDNIITTGSAGAPGSK